MNTTDVRQSTSIEIGENLAHPAVFLSSAQRSRTICYCLLLDYIIHPLACSVVRVVVSAGGFIVSAPGCPSPWLNCTVSSIPLSLSPPPYPSLLHVLVACPCLATTPPSPKIWLKREDLAHTGSHAINNAVGQALLAKRIGKSHIVTDTGAGQHGVATASMCAKLGLKCTIYMGAVDCERQGLNVHKMKILGARVNNDTVGGACANHNANALKLLPSYWRPFLRIAGGGCSVSIVLTSFLNQACQPFRVLNGIHAVPGSLNHH